MSRARRSLTVCERLVLAREAVLATVEVLGIVPALARLVGWERDERRAERLRTGGPS